MAAKEIRFGEDARARMVKGVNHWRKGSMLWRTL